MSWWQDHVEKPIRDAGGTVSDEFKSCISGGCEPSAIINKSLQGTADSMSKGFAEPVQQVIREEVDYLFDEKVNPLVGTIDQVFQERIKQVEGVSKNLLEDAATRFTELKDEVKQDLGDILDDVAGKYSAALVETKMALRYLLGEINMILENRITQLFKMVLETLAELQRMAEELMDAVRQKIIEPAFDRLDRLEDRLFQDIDRVLEQFGYIEDSVKAELQMTRKRLTEHLIPDPFDPCYKRLGIQWKTGLALENIELYRLSECQTLTELEKDIDTIEVKRVTDKYQQLQWDAWVFACYHRGAPAAWDTYLRDWIKYGKLYRVWAST